MSCLSAIGDFFSSIWDALVDQFEDLIQWFADEIVWLWKNIAYPVVKYVFNALGFDGEDVYTISVHTQQLITDDTPNSLALAVSRAIMGDRDIVGELVRTIRIGPVATMGNCQNYAEDHYVRGLPTVSYSYKDFDETLVLAAIEAETGKTIEIKSSTLGPMSNVFFGQQYLHNNYDDSHPDWYVSHTHTNPTNMITVPIPDNGSFMQFSGSNPGSFQVDMLTETMDIMYVLYIIANPPYPVESGVFEGGIPFAPVGNYYQVYYTVPTEDEFQVHLWSYQQGDGAISELDNALSGAEYFNKVLPVIALRRDFESINDANGINYDPEEDDTARRTLAVINLDFDELITNVESNEDSIDDISDAFITFGTNIYSTNQAERVVLFNLIENFYYDSAVSEERFNEVATGDAINLIRVTELHFRAAFQYNWIRREVITGSIGVVGFVETTVVILDPDPFGVDPETPPEDYGLTSYLLMEKQISETEYVRLHVDGPALTHGIKGTDGTFRMTSIQLSDREDLTARASFNLPLTLDSLDGLSYREKEDVLYRSISLTIYSSTYDYLEFYETASFASTFKILLTIVSIIIIIVTWGAGSGIVAVLWEMGKQILFNYALTFLLYEIIQEYGSDSVIALIAAAAYIYLTAVYGGGKDIGNLSPVYALLKVVTITLDVALIFIGSDLEILQQEMKDFDKTKEEKEQELEDAWDLLDGTTDYLDLARVLRTHPNETPEGFYQRTIHTGNPGVMALDEIGNFHENLLKLPKAD